MDDNKNDQNIKLIDDLELFYMMLSDEKSQLSIYHPGPYWTTYTKISSNEIKRCGILDFRGSSNYIGKGYTDNLIIDARNAYNYGLMRFLLKATQMYPLNKIHQAQLQVAKARANESIIYAQELLNKKKRTINLLDKYTMPYSLLGNCLRKVQIDGQYYSIHYLDLLDQHDNIASRINFINARSIFEIGGGFGTNIHLLLENYRNIRKVLYLDIPPNLYVGTQYLRAFYGNKVIDYRTLRHMDSIKFSADDNIEIFCIAPWQIEKFESPVDIFINSNSFVEMPNNVIKNYVDKFNGFPESKNTAIALTSYDGFSQKITLDPNELPKFFKDRKFDYFEVNKLLNSSRKNLFFVSHGAYSSQ